MPVSAQLQAALDAAEASKADALTKIQAAGDAKNALTAATAANGAALNAAVAAGASLDQARAAAHQAVDAEFTLQVPSAT